MKLMYAMIKKRKISPVRLMVTFWAILHTLRGPITITSWITHLARNLNLLGNASITYISTPRRSLDIYFFSQAHLLKQKGNRIFVTYKEFVNEYELSNKPLGLYTMETFLLDLQRLTRGVGRSPSARIMRNTVPRYTGEDGAPPAPAFTHYQGFDQPGPSEPRHRTWDDQTSYDPPTPKENWGQGNFSNYVPHEYEDSAYI
jgi:hypothetical protein